MLQHVVGENGVEDVFAQGNCAKTHGFQRLIRSQWLPDVEQRVGADGFADIHIQAVLPPVLAAAKVEQRREGWAGWRGRNSERVSEDYFLVAPCKDFKTVPGQIGPLVGVRSQFDAGVDQPVVGHRADGVTDIRFQCGRFAAFGNDGFFVGQEVGDAHDFEDAGVVVVHVEDDLGAGDVSFPRKFVCQW